LGYSTAPPLATFLLRLSPRLTPSVPFPTASLSWKVVVKLDDLKHFGLLAPSFSSSRRSDGIFPGSLFHSFFLPSFCHVALLKLKASASIMPKPLGLPHSLAAETSNSCSRESTSPLVRTILPHLVSRYFGRPDSQEYYRDPLSLSRSGVFFPPVVLSIDLPPVDFFQFCFYLEFFRNEPSDVFDLLPLEFFALGRVPIFLPPPFASSRYVGFLDEGDSAPLSSSPFSPTRTHCAFLSSVSPSSFAGLLTFSRFYIFS